MKRILIFTLLLTVTLALASCATSGSETQPTATSSSAAATTTTPPQFLSVSVISIKPEMVTEWEAFLKAESLPAYQKAGVKQRDVWKTATFGDVFEYVVVTPIENFAQYDGTALLVKALGEEGARAYRAKAARFIANYRIFSLQMRPDLSLESKSNETPKLAVVSTVSTAPGRAPEFESLLKTDFLPVIKKAELKGYMVSQTTYGGDPYEYTAVALYDTFAEIGKGSPYVKVLGQEGAGKLLQKATGIVTHVERKVYRYVPELSLQLPKA